MTSRSRRSQHKLGWLKMALAVGAVAATVAGTRLLAAEEVAPTSASIVVPPSPTGERSGQAPALPPTFTNRAGLNLELPAIPRVVSPNIRPVTRSRSSR